MHHFALIPGAIEAMPSHTWVYPGDVIEKPLNREELRAALRRAEAHLRLLRTQLNSDL